MCLLLNKGRKRRGRLRWYAAKLRPLVTARRHHTHNENAYWGGTIIAIWILQQLKLNKPLSLSIEVNRSTASFQQPRQASMLKQPICIFLSGGLLLTSTSIDHLHLQPKFTYSGKTTNGAPRDGTDDSCRGRVFFLGQRAFHLIWSDCRACCRGDIATGGEQSTTGQRIAANWESR